VFRHPSNQDAPQASHNDFDSDAHRWQTASDQFGCSNSLTDLRLSIALMGVSGRVELAPG
jgi:hypothetical protein